MLDHTKPEDARVQASEDAHVALHTVWTATVGTPQYDKRAWRNLDIAITKLRTARALVPASEVLRLIQAAKDQGAGDARDWEKLEAAVKTLSLHL